MGDSQGPAVECLRSELEKAKRRGDDQSTSRSTSAASSLPDQRRGSSTWTRNGPKRWRPFATLGSRASIRSGCTTSANDPAPRLANRNGCSEGQVGGYGGRAGRSSARHSAEAPGSGSPGSIHPSNAHFGPSGTRRLDAGPSFGSAGCHDRGRGGRSASLGDHIEDGRRGRVFAANDRQFHGVMREDRSARSRDSRYGLRGVRVGEASNPGPVQTRQARRAEHDRVIADRRVVHRENDEPLQDTAPDSVSTIRSRRPASAFATIALVLGQ